MATWKPRGLFPGANVTGAASPLMGGPLPGPTVEQVKDPSTRQTLWRSQTYRMRLTGFSQATPIADRRFLTSAILLFSDTQNFSRLYIGSRELTIDGGGVASNSYFTLDPGRSAFIWTDTPQIEVIDVAQYFVLPASQSGAFFLHVTAYQNQVLAS